MAKNLDKNWKIEGTKLLVLETRNSLNKPIVHYDLNCLCNAIGATDAFKASLVKQSRAGTGAIIGAVFDHPFLGLAMGAFMSSETMQKPDFAEITLFFTDGEMIDLTIDEKQLRKFQKILAANLDRHAITPLATGGKVLEYEDNDHIIAQLNRRTSRRAYIESLLKVPIMTGATVTALWLGLLGLYLGGHFMIDLLKTLTRQEVTPIENYLLPFSDYINWGIVVLISAIIGAVGVLFSYTSLNPKGRNHLITIFKNKKEEAFAREKLGDDYVNKLLKEHRVETLLDPSPGRITSIYD